MYINCRHAGLGEIRLCHHYDYQPVTVLFDGRTDVIYQRFVARDQSPERHRGHVVNTQYPEAGDAPPYVPMPLEMFSKGMDFRGFRRFDIGGEIICVDTTDFNRVDYEEINDRIAEALDSIHN